MCLKKLPGLLRGGVGWGLGTMFARQGDTAENNDNITINVCPIPFQIEQANIAAKNLLFF